ncbi:MAG: glycosyltransferase family 2 protein [Candidatus Omnitrophica bacterium]|nr:glycosyltransferase family 2 protein [Candidatus Omnitrophota bacterium]
MAQPSLSVVMPCLNEERNVEEAVRSTLRALDRFGIPGEVIVVNDGSRDKTAEVAGRLASQDPRVRTISHSRPQGIGASFWDGARSAGMDYVTMIPGDNENVPEELLTYFSLTRDVDMVVPFVYNVEVRSLFRRILSSFYRLIINFSFGTNLNYTNGTVIYNRRALQEIELGSKGFFYQTELLVRLIRAGYLYAEVPYFLKGRKVGTTKAVSLKSLRAVAEGYLRLVWDVHVARRAGRAGGRLHPGSATAKRIRHVETPS